ncbi:hypothetical protein WR25_15167 [Diploscapter pachys]|uniref:Invertebrate defensins family profile domain-containing protein n=1 Tax=Diploscapter pachys TaxID=2018661 RepID=A0A2A2KNU9_9BILA|nr:hypothetical protein WR25_15167 [Diploscapter pachys]
MRAFLVILFAVVALQFVSAAIDFSTCARMDVPILNKVARGLCITSCSAQNCGTGYCRKRRGRPTCVCSRCADGGNVPLDQLVKGKGK